MFSSRHWDPSKRVHFIICYVFMDIWRDITYMNKLDINLRDGGIRDRSQAEYFPHQNSKWPDITLISHLTSLQNLRGHPPWIGRHFRLTSISPNSQSSPPRSIQSQSSIQLVAPKCEWISVDHLCFLVLCPRSWFPHWDTFIILIVQQ